ncbi:Alpha/Beta hydrolase protein [Crassisporium funariophilum]|nr:Alpha/Beta hydrolase protein [Crassisporium funariophilum]
MSMPDKPISLSYKCLEDKTPVTLDVYLPPQTQADESLPTEGYSLSNSLIPAVIYFHGGGLTVGNKDSWFPFWLHKRVLALGYAFVSADYQLLPPATGHDIVQDIKDLLTFLTTTRIRDEGCLFKIDPNGIAVSGSSAGGLCAYLAAMHCVSPKPRAVVSMYGMGGNFLTPHYLRVKQEVFFRGREILDPADFSQYLYPFKDGMLVPTCDSPLAYHPQTYRIPGYPANPRMLLPRLYLQLGIFLNYYTGKHDPSLSDALRQALEADDVCLENLRKIIPECHRALFPQFGVDGAWPPTLMLHGTDDTAVPVAESRHLRALLDGAGVQVELLEFEGMEHSFDYEPDAEILWSGRFDTVKNFLATHLGTAENNL